MNPQITITQQFCGPPNSGNGGYTCGMLANHIKGPAEVTLKLPPPLNQAMDVTNDSEGGFMLLDGERVVAMALPASVEIDIPAPPAYDTAFKAAGNHPMMDTHFFSCCFVCGPDRKPADGLRIFAGMVDDQAYVAAPWIPDHCFADELGMVRNEIIWASLDCPGAWAALTDRLRPIVLGRMAVEIINPVKADQKLVVIGWKIAEEGRKIQVGTALFTEDRQLLAKSRAIWIELK